VIIGYNVQHKILRRRFEMKNVLKRTVGQAVAVVCAAVGIAPFWYYDKEEGDDD